jgi:hypothetical protein
VKSIHVPSGQAGAAVAVADGAGGKAVGVAEGTEVAVLSARISGEGAHPATKSDPAATIAAAPRLPA